MLKSILYGLISAQAISSFHVYFSNLKLYKFLTAADSAGYLIVPNHNILPSLKALGPTIFGGLFFTLTVGAGLAILSYYLYWVWICIFERRKSFLYLLLGLWLITLVLFNIQGFSLFPSLYLVIIPIIVAGTRLIPINKLAPEISRLSVIIHLAPVLLLAILWFTEHDEKMFYDIRDNLLLSNKIGQKINHFYYKYTLYPAEAFKTFEQKQIKGCYIEPFNDQALTTRLENELLDHDYLIFDSSEGADLRLQVAEGDLYFFKPREIVHLGQINDFLSHPGDVLKTFSQKTDTNGYFRYLIKLSLLIGFPVLIYLFFYSLFAWAFRFFMLSEWAGRSASLVCFVLSLMILFTFQANSSHRLSTDDIEQNLESSEWQQRIAALRFIVENNLEIGKFPGYKELLNSPHIPEKYWLAKAIGKSRSISTIEEIISLLDDPHPNIVCIALESLGNRRDKRSISLVMQKLKSSDHWYIEWYAYRALRSLGWKQKKSA